VDLGRTHNPMGG